MFICKCCGKEFTDDYRKSRKLRKKTPQFCSRSCANKRIDLQKSWANDKRLEFIQLKNPAYKPKYCSCGNLLKTREANRNQQLCSSCIKIKKDKKLSKYNDILKRWKSGSDVSKEVSYENEELNMVYKGLFKKAILEEQNYSCSICGISNLWNNKTLGFILDHIDGNWRNHLHSNLRLVCPNCNSQLSTTGSRNRGFGRISLRIRRKLGKL